MGEELPLGGVEVVGEGAALTGDELGEDIRLQRLDVGFLEQGVQAVKIAGLRHDDQILGRDIANAADAAETEFGPAGVDLGGGHRIVDGVHVAVLLAAPEDRGHGVLHLEILRGELGGILQTGEGEGLLQESLVAGLELCVGLEEIVITVAHAQAALAQVQDLHVAVGKVRLDAGAEEAAFAVEVHLSKDFSHFVQVRNRLDFGDIGLDGLGAKRVAGGGVEGHPVQVGEIFWSTVPGSACRVAMFSNSSFRFFWVVSAMASKEP